MNEATLDPLPSVDEDRFRRWRRENFGRLLVRALDVFQADLRAVRDDAETLPALASSDRRVLESLDLKGSRITEIARRAGLAKQTVGPLVRELSELGFLEIESDPEDGRAKRVRFSDRGLRQVTVGLEAIDAVVDSYTQVLGEQFMWHLQSSLLMFLECFERRETESQTGG